MKKDIFNDLIIFEMANNHQGDVNHGLEIVKSYGDLAKKHNIHGAIKLQYRDLPNFVHVDYRNKEDVKHVKRFLETMLSKEGFKSIITEIKKQELTSVCTPFDENSVDLAVAHGIDILKIASCSAMDWPLCEKVAKSGKPVIISTGGLLIPDIDKIYNFFIHRGVQFALLHCIALYPAGHNDLHMNFMDVLKKRYRGIPIGYSGHEMPADVDVAKIAVAKGAQILERHVGLPSENIRLNAYSMNPEETDAWLTAVAETQKICSGSMLRSGQAEAASLRELARGVFASCPIQKGERLAGKTFFAMPCQEGQLTSGTFKPDIHATQDYKENEAIYETLPETGTSLLRSVVHQVKGMLMEHAIFLKDDVEFEISHHYGRAKVREYGAVIITIVNRQYCKKLLVLLPGQTHPTHFHKQKEETFHVLAGTLYLLADDKEVILSPGDIHTLPPGVRHSFHASEDSNGVIFEEISTMSNNDSIYDDDIINRLDLFERKTLMNTW